MVERTQREITKTHKIITVLGPTASGKTQRAVAIAKNLNGEIISADSRQVYRNMDLGTGKDLEEYNGIPYYLIDICEAGEKYNLHRYITDFRKALSHINTQGKQAILCGGTGMYLETALSGIELPEVAGNRELRKRLEKKSLEELTEILKQYKTLHNTTDVDTVKRAVRAIEIEEFYRENKDVAIKADRRKSQPLDSLIIGIDIPREERRKRITQRLEKRLENGMLREVRNLLDKGISPDDLIYYGLEYKYLTLHAIGNLSYEEMVKSLEIAIHQFSKRQMTWFRGMEKRGFKINWLPFDMGGLEFVEAVRDLIKNNP